MVAWPDLESATLPAARMKQRMKNDGVGYHFFFRSAPARAPLVTRLLFFSGGEQHEMLVLLVRVIIRIVHKQHFIIEGEKCQSHSLSARKVFRSENHSAEKSFQSESQNTKKKETRLGYYRYNIRALKTN